MKTIYTILLCSMVALITGCASIAGNNSRAVHVNSYPQGAGIFVDNQQYGVTPATINLPTYIYGGKSVTMRKRGYQDQSAMVNSQFQPIALLDIFFWPTFIIDAATGNLVKMNPADTNISAKLLHA